MCLCYLDFVQLRIAKVKQTTTNGIDSTWQPLESVQTSAVQDAGKPSDVQNTANASVVQDADSLKALFLKTCRMYPRLFVALVYTPQSGLWLMATPEILLKGEQNQMATMSLAGTQKAEPSKTVADYPVEGVEWSEKNREEQQYVTDYIEDCIKAFSDDYQKKGQLIPRWLPISIISVPTSLSVCMIRGVWAMCSTPYILRLPSAEYRRMKLAGLSCSMNISRANTTVVLWDQISPKGKTHLYVSLRCMNILDDGSCELYAGGGLLKESEMEKEWKETEAKMLTILSVL